MAALVSTDALCLTWLSNTALGTARLSYAYPGSLAVSSSTVAHAIFEERILGRFVIEYRRTTNSGASWTPAIPLSSPDIGEAGVPAIDASGNAVDAVWVEGDSIIASSDSAVVYRRSTDAGATWTEPVHLSPLFESAGFPRVVHSGSLVIVTWTDAASGKVWVRVSTNGGASFATRINLGTTTNKPFTGLYDAFPVAAVGSGVVVVGYYSGPKALKIRRSTTSGATWKAAQSIATNAAGSWPASVAAAGSTVLVGYASKTSSDIWTVARRSADKGTTFAAAVALSPAFGAPSFQPVITYRAGAFRAAFERCTSNTCAFSNTFYRSSTTGKTWTAALLASVRTTRYDAPADIDVATKVLVLYDDADEYGNDAYVRRGG